MAALAARSIWDSQALVLAITIAAMPALVLLAAVWPATALGVLVAGQVLEAFEYPTAAGTVSFGVILLGLLLLFHWRNVLDAIRRDRDLVVASSCSVVGSPPTPFGSATSPPVRWPARL